MSNISCFAAILCLLNGYATIVAPQASVLSGDDVTSTLPYPKIEPKERRSQPQTLSQSLPFARSRKPTTKSFLVIQTTNNNPPSFPYPYPLKGLPDVVDILGVRFERWRSSNDANTSKAGTKFVDEDKKMMLLYLPGIEGLGTSVEPQLPALSAKFDVFRLIIGAEDRSTFSTLSRAVSAGCSVRRFWQ